MDQSPSCETNIQFPGTDITCFFMEPKKLLPCLQEPAIGPCLEPKSFSIANPHYFFKVSFNVTLQLSTLNSLNYSCLCRLSDTNNVNIFTFPTQAVCLAHLMLFNFFTVRKFSKDTSYRAPQCELFPSCLLSIFL
jgi:hypothetical protein